MIEVDPAPHAAMNLREFSVHIVTIVIGLLIAIGLEQTVSHFHQKHLGRDIEEDLRQESISNAGIVRYNMVSVQSVRRNIRANMTQLDLALARNNKGPLILNPPPHDTFLPVVDSAWLTLRDNGLMSLVSPQVATNYWKADFVGHDIDDNLGSLAITRRKVNSFVHLHRTIQELTPEERHDLLLAYSDEDQALGNLNYLLLGFDYLNQAIIDGKTPSIADLASESVKAQRYEGEPVY